MLALLIFAIVLALASAEVYSNATVSACSYSATCTVSGTTGVCVSASGNCCSGGTFYTGYCPGGNDIKCCIKPTCSTPYGSGTCQTTSSCSGTSFSGYCSGPSNIQCCVGSAPTPTPGTGHYGIDISTVLSDSNAKCFASSGITAMIPRAYRSSGSVDPNVCTSLKAAKNAGIGIRDGYLFPCPTCSTSAYNQVKAAVDNLKNCGSGVWTKKLYLDIEGSQYWSSSTSTNKSWFQSLVDACGSLGVNCGVYTSSSQWSAIFGSTSYTYAKAAAMALWYPHYDGKDNFSDFKPFGGWTKPYMKQYLGDKTMCSMGVDKNYY